ncbi:neuroligin-4, X-linked-like [Oculina patagonica]
MAMMFMVLLKTVCYVVFMPLVILSVRVSTKYGDLEGILTPYPNATGPYKSISKFLGIPYAAPPIGELRLKPPQLPSEWKPNVRPAKRHGNICLQGPELESRIKRVTYQFEFSEDCLFLDVYSPDVSLKLPVLFYIHGGSFVAGTSLLFPGDMLALQGVVVVVIQYRLGPLGFMSTGDSASPGNYGMLDQVEALTWVRENIEQFGGDPEKVTIFGQDAGAISVSLHLSSPWSRGLFNQAIAESGMSFHLQSISEAFQHTKKLAQKLDCDSLSNHTLVSCILNKKATAVNQAMQLIDWQYHEHLIWSPVVDNNFIYDNPQNARKEEKFEKVSLLLGFNSHKGASSLELMMKNTFGLTASAKNGVRSHQFKTLLKKFSEARHAGKTADLVADALEFQYTPWRDQDNVYALRDKLIGLIGDYFYVVPTHEIATIHSNFAPVYLYEFSHRSKGNQHVGAAHGDNVPYDFGIPFLETSADAEGFPNYDTIDRQVSWFVMTLYTNFAKYGNPTPQPVSGVTWQQFNSTHRAYLRVDANPAMVSCFDPRRMAFWNNYYPRLMRVEFGVPTEVVDSFMQFIMSVIIIMVFGGIAACAKLNEDRHPTVRRDRVSHPW